MLAIFDIDGTVCDTQDVEGECYARAFEEVFGFSLKTVDWTQFEEPTSSGIVRSLCGEMPEFEKREKRFRDVFVNYLQEARPQFPGDFSQLVGAVEFIERLSADSSVSVAFATGGYDSEAAFKLRCCGIDIHEYPHATSSDTPRRRDIISIAAFRAGSSLSSAVYFGDAPWDVQACDALKIPMIGIGRRIDQLRSLGLSSVFHDFSEPELLYAAMENLAGASAHNS